MAWKTQGDERIKQYRVYRELEEQYNAALAELQALRIEVLKKNATIRHLAAELATVPEMVAEPEPPITEALDDSPALPPILPKPPVKALPNAAKPASGEYPRVSSTTPPPRGLSLREKLGGGKP
jgi:hypothetical protein